MALLTTIVSISSSLLLAPFLIFLLVILFLASIGKSIGVRRLYVKLLLKLFEYGRQHVEIANKQRCEEDSGFSSEDEGDGNPDSKNGGVKTNGEPRNGHPKNGFGPTTVISREDLILAPDPHHNYGFHKRSDSGNHNYLSHRRSDSGNHNGGFTLSSPTSEKQRSQERLDQANERLKELTKEPEPMNEPQNELQNEPQIELQNEPQNELQNEPQDNDGIRNRINIVVDDDKENENPNGSGDSNVESNDDAKSEESQDVEDPNNSSKDHRRLSFETLRREFELADCLTYIKAGMESIIEDEVTQCFEAEELKSWNLLTRTNRHYEFINTRLTIIWVLGFIVRYCFLLPLRVTICFVGAANMVFSSLVIMCIPIPWLKRWCNKKAMLITFRLLARGLSAVITYHNKEYAPTKSGICVANHTTPVDIVMVATNNIFALVCWLTFCTAVVGYVPKGSFKRRLNQHVSIHCFGLLSSAISAVITYHNPENKPARGICVANHTSPIDVLVLACDNCYALIGQRHGGFLGLLQRALARASSHIWFERSEVKDREFVTRRLRQHVSDPNNPPILIFPEGTCINNTSVMQFKKGSFEVGGDIYPVAIKYDAKFGDAFWNSSKYSMLQYIYMMMTSWAIVCDVWYLPPMKQEEGESSIDFANRVKSVIAHQGGLVDLMWDGQLKRVKAKKEWKEMQQEEFSRHLKVA